MSGAECDRLLRRAENICAAIKKYEEQALLKDDEMLSCERKAWSELARITGAAEVKIWILQGMQQEKKSWK